MTSAACETEAAINFYKHYIGDFQRDTGHLSLTERGAYRALLDHHYATEKPLPADTTALCRIVGAVSKAERDAVASVLKEFWQRSEDGWSNARALIEMGKADHQRDVNRATAEARERRRKEARGKSGKQHEQHYEPPHEQSTNRATNDQPNQTPDTRHQRNTENQERATAPPLARSREVDPLENPDPASSPTPCGAVCLAMRKAGLQAVNPGDPRLMAMVQQGATVEEFEAVAVDAVAGGKGFAWALKALEGRRSDASKIALTERQSGSRNNAWEGAR